MTTALRTGRAHRQIPEAMCGERSVHETRAMEVTAAITLLERLLGAAVVDRCTDPGCDPCMAVRVRAA